MHIHYVVDKLYQWKKMTFAISKYEAIDDVSSKVQEESVYHLNESPERANLNSNHDDYELNPNEDADQTDFELARAKRITGLDAASALVKGNLGPGCLNLPFAFALTGWVVGSFFFLIVAVQGIYSMWLLTYCKQVSSIQSNKICFDHQRLLFFY